jgi:hypothetical protein
MKHKYLLIIVLLCTVSQARAAEMLIFHSGNTLLEKCEAYVNKTYIATGNVCAGYIEGIVDAHAAYVGWGHMEKKFCIPETVMIDQLVRVVTEDLQDRPEDLHLTGGSLVANALFLAFPCTDN